MSKLLYTRWNGYRGNKTNFGVVNFLNNLCILPHMIDFSVNIVSYQLPRLLKETRRESIRFRSFPMGHLENSLLDFMVVDAILKTNNESHIKLMIGKPELVPLADISIHCVSIVRESLE